MIPKRFPDVFYNWPSMIGALVALLSLNVLALLLLLDSFVQHETPYLSLLIYLIMPGFLLLGLVLIAVGILLERQRRKRQRDAVAVIKGEIEVDMDNPLHRNAVLIWVMGTAALGLSSVVGTYMAYHATESVEFCGLVCHSVMKPEYTAYQLSPHARVTCTDCHIGPGADWFVQAKFSGLRQVVAIATDSYARPISTPIEHLRPARDTCEQCHWPEKFFGARKDVNYHFMGDEENTPYPITMLLNIGGGSEEQGPVEGIHWHVAPSIKVEYVARDAKRLEIAWVRFTDGSGEEKIYNNMDEPLSAEELAGASVRTMDCMDCHNRPSHKYRSPNRTVNEAIAQDRIDRDLPYIKMQSITVLDQTYEDTPIALQKIEEGILGFYREDYPEVLEDQSESVAQTIAVLQEIYQQNFFPEMKVAWRQYPEHVGHSEFIGCFRCHGSELETEEGETISKDCNLCHSILTQGEAEEEALIAPSGLIFEHPEDIDGDEFLSPCTECHEGGAEIY